MYIKLCFTDPEDKPDPKNHLIDGMWLGVSIASQGQPGGRVVVNFITIIPTNM